MSGVWLGWAAMYNLYVFLLNSASTTLTHCLVDEKTQTQESLKKIDETVSPKKHSCLLTYGTLDFTTTYIFDSNIYKVHILVRRVSKNEDFQAKTHN